MLQPMYFTFICPLFEYADIVWDSCSLECKHMLENIQLDIAHTVTRAMKFCSIEKIYKQAGKLCKKGKANQTHKLCRLFKMVKKNWEILPLTSGLQ